MSELGARENNSLETVGDLLELVLLFAIGNVDLGMLGRSDDAIPHHDTVVGLGSGERSDQSER